MVWNSLLSAKFPMFLIQVYLSYGLLKEKLCGVFFFKPFFFIVNNLQWNLLRLYKSWQSLTDPFYTVCVLYYLIIVMLIYWNFVCFKHLFCICYLPPSYCHQLNPLTPDYLSHPLSFIPVINLCWVFYCNENILTWPRKTTCPSERCRDHYKSYRQDAAAERLLRTGCVI